MTSFKITVLSDGFRDYGVIGNDGKWWELCKKCRLKPLEASEALESMNRCASARHFHQSNISTVFIESIESAPFDNPVYATEPSFPRKWESRTWGLGNCFYPISFCADSSG
ncbi:TPA: hypothetical protein ACKL0V_002215, partial [Neisseria gonorrhoeae]